MKWNTCEVRFLPASLRATSKVERWPFLLLVPRQNRDAYHHENIQNELFFYFVLLMRPNTLCLFEISPEFFSTVHFDSAGALR